MDIFFPRISLKQLPILLALAALGAVIAGAYGIIHDQITYSISQEYFTKFKFRQFSHTDFGFPVRVRVAEIGFLATWWVGFIAGWFLARYAVRHLPPNRVIGHVLTGFWMILGCALISGFLGWAAGFYWLRGDHLDSWEDWQLRLNLTDLRNFAIVGYIHGGGYLGALLGLIAGIFYLKKKSGPARESASSTEDVKKAVNDTSA